MDAFEYIVEQILNKCCVPVAGAGISYLSEHPDGYTYHHVSTMVVLLKEAILKSRHRRYDKIFNGAICDKKCIEELEKLGLAIDKNNLSKTTCFFCDVVEASKMNRLGNLAELYLWEFESIQTSYLSLIQLLNIPTYRDLEPTNAHVKIAKLAREGLISEILTTNYDCNFEKAYGLVAGDGGYDVIASLSDYRSKGARCGDFNYLKIYKINGCAKELLDGTDSKKCESIMLTERQLQNWRNRQWAADIFRDRMRSKTLFFNGFGSDEPQVHHTLQAVIEEYVEGSTKISDPVLNLNAAPIVAIYDQHPTFHQQQIVTNFALSHGLNPLEGSKLFIRNPNLDSTHSADELWQSIYERVSRSLLIKALYSNLLSQNASFKSIIPYSETIIHSIISSFESAKDKDKNQSTNVPDWLKILELVDGITVTDENRVENFIKCLAMIRDGYCGTYFPVTENEALITELLFTIFVLKERLGEKVERESGRGIKLQLRGDTGATPAQKDFYLNSDISLIKGSVRSKYVSGNSYLAIAIGQTGSYFRPSLTRILSVKDGSRISPKTIICLGWKHIFHEKPFDGNMECVSKTIVSAIESPTNYFYENQSSIKNRSYLKLI